MGRLAKCEAVKSLPPPEQPASSPFKVDAVSLHCARNAEGKEPGLAVVLRFGGSLWRPIG